MLCATHWMAQKSIKWNELVSMSSRFVYVLQVYGPNSDNLLISSRCQLVTCTVSMLTVIFSQVFVIFFTNFVKNADTVGSGTGACGVSVRQLVSWLVHANSATYRWLWRGLTRRTRTVRTRYVTYRWLWRGLTRRTRTVRTRYVTYRWLWRGWTRRTRTVRTRYVTYRWLWRGLTRRTRTVRTKYVT